MFWRGCRMPPPRDSILRSARHSPRGLVCRTFANRRKPAPAFGGANPRNSLQGMAEGEGFGLRRDRGFARDLSDPRRQNGEINSIAVVQVRNRYERTAGVLARIHHSTRRTSAGERLRRRLAPATPATAAADTSNENVPRYVSGSTRPTPGKRAPMAPTNTAAHTPPTAAPISTGAIPATPAASRTLVIDAPRAILTP